MEVGQYKGLKIGAIIQARIGSSRLPGKVLMNLPMNSNKTVLEHILKRVPKEIQTIIATSINSIDDSIAEKYYNTFRGSENDVLSRFYECATQYNFDHIIRLTGDNPIVDSTILEDVLNKHIDLEMDYSKTEGLPLGTNFEIISFNALKESFYKAKSNFEREHVTVYVRENSISNFKTQIIEFKNFTPLRLTIDYPSDFALINLLFNALGDDLNLQEINEFEKKNPWISEINNKNVQLS